MKEALQERDEAMQQLVNRLAQELAHIQRTVAATHQRLAATTRSLEVRTLELAEARATHALLLSTLDMSRDGIVAMGCFGRALHFNTRFLEIWRVPPAKAETLDDAALLALQLTRVKDPARFLDFVQARRARPDEERCQMVQMTDGRLLECRMLPQRVRGRRLGTVTRFREVVPAY